MAYGIVGQHGGFLDVVSAPGEGAAFSVHLPLVSREPTEGGDSPVDSGASGGHERILVAEDDPFARDVFLKVLSGAGYEVTVAIDGAEATQAFLREPDAFHLILLDVVMPKRSGQHVYESLRAVRPDVPVVFASGYPNEVLSSDLSSEAAVSYLQKPVTPEVLLARVRKVLDAAQEVSAPL